MIFDLKKREDKEIQRVCNKAIKELKKFYEIKNKIRVNVIILKDRKTFDALRNCKTKDWNIGFAVPHVYSVFILDKKNFEKESSHKYSKEYYAEVIKHEISHILFYKLMGDTKCPSWFAEGVALYTDGHVGLMKKPEKFESFLKFYKPGPGMYKESGFVIKLLIEKSGKKKLLELIKKTKGIRNKRNFEKLFKKHYGFDLNYKNMNKLL